MGSRKIAAFWPCLAAIAGFGWPPVPLASDSAPVRTDHTVVLDSDGWRLAGRFLSAGPDERRPAALLLHRAAGHRGEYDSLAIALADRGICSLSLDLRGHGESTNLGRFQPPYAEHLHINAEAWRDVNRALDWLAARDDVDASRLIVVGASYSGEAAALGMREGGRVAAAYVMLSPGNFSDESILAATETGSNWLFVRSIDEGPAAQPHIDALFEALQALAPGLERRVLNGAGHATSLFDDRPSLPRDLADWIAAAVEAR